MELTPEFLLTGLISYGVFLFSLSVHEAAHAYVADRCGDPTGRLMGRITLNPIPHMELLGTLILPLMMTFGGPLLGGMPFLFGWAKPVPFNPRNLRNMRRDPALIGLAGPMSNLLLAVICTILARIVVTLARTAPDNPVFGILLGVLFMMVAINLLLMMFNLLPIPPLDGGHLLYPFLSENGQRVLDQIGPFGIIIAIMAARYVLPGPLGLLFQGVHWFVMGGVS